MMTNSPNENYNYPNLKKDFIKFFSLNELFYIENISVDPISLKSECDYKNFFLPFIIRELDSLKGIYKNNFTVYKIEAVEYEEFDRLNEYLKDENLYNNYDSFKRIPFINGFYIDKETEIEFINYVENPGISNLDLFTR